MSKSRNLLFNPPDFPGWVRVPSECLSPSLCLSVPSPVLGREVRGEGLGEGRVSQNIWEKMRGKKLLVAFSGGKDSLTLLHYLFVYKSLMGWEITACHVNHNLRGQESLRDAGFCQNWCFDREIPFIGTSIDVSSALKDLSRGVEYAARVCRYRSLKEARVSSGCGYILTAHTSDDRLESFFIDLMTGASLFTIGGADTARGYLLRPLLGFSCANVEEYLKRNALSPVYDGSNDDERYYRNLVRRKVIPVIKELDGGIIKSISRIQDESVVLRDWMDERTAGAVCHMPEGGVAIDRKVLNPFSSAERGYLIGKWLSFFCRGGRVHAEAVLKQLDRQRSVRLNLPEGWLAEITPRTVRIFPALSVTPFYAEKPCGVRCVELPGRRVLFPPDMANNRYCLRSRKNGDRFNGKRIKELFEKGKLDPYLRDRAVIVEDSGGIVWAEHLKNPHGAGIEVTYFKQNMS